VALRALQVGVRVCQRETGRAVVECRDGPGCGVVAVGAIGGRKYRASARMGRVVGLLPSSKVAARVPAVGSGDLQMIVVVDVTLLAGQVAVARGEGEVYGRAGVVSGEHSSEPAVEGPVTVMAAVGRKIPGIRGVRWIGGLLPILQVARLTFRGKSVEDSDGGLRVAVFTLNSGMRAEQWEAVLVILHLLSSDGPALHGMALLAIRSHLAAVDVICLVAIRAILANVLKHRLQMARGAFNFLVHSTKWVVGFVVIELRNRADGFPTRGGVAVFARNRKWSVRTTRGLLLRIRRARERGSQRGRGPKKEQNRPQSELKQDSRRVLHSAAGLAAKKFRNLGAFVCSHYLEPTSRIQLYDWTVRGQLD